MADIVVRTKNRKQMKPVLSCDAVRTVIADFGCASIDIQKIKEEHPEKRFYLQLPDVLREKKADSVKEIAEKAAAFDGIVIKNFDEFGLLTELKEAGVFDLSDPDYHIVGDSFLYAYNADAVAFYKSFYPRMELILSDELTDREAEALRKTAEERGVAAPSDFIYKAYGYQPLMITNQCMNRNYAGCAKPLMRFSDEKKNAFYITSECGQCYDIVYNGLPTVMLDKLEQDGEGFLSGGIRFDQILLDFTIEDEDEIGRILRGFPCGPEKAAEFRKQTRGHHLKGVM